MLFEMRLLVLRGGGLRFGRVVGFVVVRLLLRNEKGGDKNGCNCHDNKTDSPDLFDMIEKHLFFILFNVKGCYEIVEIQFFV